MRARESRWVFLDSSHPDTGNCRMQALQLRHNAHLSVQLAQTIIPTLTLIASQFEASRGSIIR